jgi:uroporphyrinogen decarboxylase
VLIPDLIEAGIDAINPLEPLAGMDLAELKKQYGKDVTLIGGVDCSQLLPFGKPQEIRDEVKRLLDIGAPGGGFIVGDSSCILPDTPVENVLAFYETVHEYAF